MFLKKYKILIITALFLTVNLLSCDRNEFLPDLEGDLVGYVYTFNEFSQLFEDHSGVTITSIGLNGKRFTVTDKNGRFQFYNLPAGTYEMHFKKNGFGTLKQFGIKHLGGEPTILGMPYDHSLNGETFFIYELPTTKIINLVIENDTIYCTFSFTKPEPEYLYIRLFFSEIENFELLEAAYVKRYFTRQINGVYSSQLTFNDLPFNSGNRVFFRAYAFPDYSKNIQTDHYRIISGINTYFDYDKNIFIYPAIGSESEQFSFILP